MSAETISIIIPTQRRPGGLARAMTSALSQSGVAASRLELVVVDNDLTPSANAAVLALAQTAPFPVRYVHERRSGVSNARNAAVAVSSGDWIAFLDDDEEAPDGWLAALLDCGARFQADVVFGPVRARVPDAVKSHRDYLKLFFSRIDSSEAGPLDRFYGCGNSLVRRAALPRQDQPFSALRNQRGGEDDFLFGEMRAQGARFVWAPEAWVWEDPIPERLTLRYTLARAFAYGQGPSASRASATPPDWLGVAGWMIVGLGQVGIFGLWAAFKWLTRAPDRAFITDRAIRGLGKVLWWRGVAFKFYGRGPALN